MLLYKCAQDKQKAWKLVAVFLCEHIKKIWDFYGTQRILFSPNPGATLGLHCLFAPYSKHQKTSWREQSRSSFQKWIKWWKLRSVHKLIHRFCSTVSIYFFHIYIYFPALSKNIGKAVHFKLILFEIKQHVLFRDSETTIERGKKPASRIWISDEIIRICQRLIS